MKKKVLVYPFDEQFSPILRYQNLLTDLEITRLVTPLGWGIVDKDAGTVDGGSPLGYPVSADFESALEQCDLVLINQVEDELDFDKSILPKMIQAAEAGKEILCTFKLQADRLGKIEEICQQSGVQFTYLGQKDDSPMVGVQSERLVEVNTPVIFVLGISEKTNKFDIQLALRTHLTQQGYKVGQIGTRNYCELLGFHSMPQYMFSAMKESEKIVRFNGLVKQIEKEEDPDVIIIGLPGGVMPLNNTFTNGFGILAYEIAQAVRPDAAILSLLYEDYTQDYFEKVGTSLRYKLGFEIDAFNVSNNKLDWENSSLNLRKIYLTLNNKFVQGKIGSLATPPKPVFNLLTPGDGLKMTTTLIDQLAGYAEVVLM